MHVLQPSHDSGNVEDVAVRQYSRMQTCNKQNILDLVNHIILFCTGKTNPIRPTCFQIFFVNYQPI
jgi:hypothetical protein